MTEMPDILSILQKCYRRCAGSDEEFLFYIPVIIYFIMRDFFVQNSNFKSKNGVINHLTRPECGWPRGRQRSRIVRCCAEEWLKIRGLFLSFVWLAHVISTGASISRMCLIYFATTHPHLDMRYLSESLGFPFRSLMANTHSLISFFLIPYFSKQNKHAVKVNYKPNFSIVWSKFSLI